MHRLITIRSICAPSGNWYRVTGSRDEPRLEKVVVWAVIETRPANPDGGEPVHQTEHTIVGIPAGDIGVMGGQADEWLMDIAGYLELSEADVGLIIKEPSRLPQEGLVWDD